MKDTDMKPYEVASIIVVRKGSLRIPEKSLQHIGGKTLLQNKIEQLKQCKHIDRVIVGSDSIDMLEHASECGAEAVRRPDYYCDESRASANEMIRNMCELVQTDVIVWAHCTNPFISSATYDRAVEQFFSQKEHDSLLSVVKLQEHLWNADGTPHNYDPYAPRHTPARQLPPYYMQDGGIFINTHQSMLSHSYFFGKRPSLFEIPSEEFMDINDERDLICARALFAHRLQRQTESQQTI